MLTRVNNNAMGGSSISKKKATIKTSSNQKVSEKGGSVHFEGGEDEEEEEEDEDDALSGGSKEDEEMIRRRDQDHMLYLRQMGISDFEIENTDLPTREHVVALKNIFRLRYPQFMTNILKILLEMDEEVLACQLVAYYELSLDDDLVLYALEKKLFSFLKFIWIFQKNFLGQRYLYDVDNLTG